MQGMPKVLLIEDNEMNSDMLSRRLRRKGYDVVLARDGAERLAAVAAEKPDVVLMDMSLPVLDGRETPRRLKAAPETRSIPVIALTAHAMASDREKAIEAGCDDYDTKPISCQPDEKIERLTRRALWIVPQRLVGHGALRRSGWMRATARTGHSAARTARHASGKYRASDEPKAAAPPPRRCDRSVARTPCRAHLQISVSKKPARL